MRNCDKCDGSGQLEDEGGSTFSDPELDALLEKATAAYLALPPEEQRAHDRAQRISFVLGNLQLDGINVTEKQVAAAVDRQGEHLFAGEGWATSKDLYGEKGD